MASAIAIGPSSITTSPATGSCCRQPPPAGPRRANSHLGSGDRPSSRDGDPLDILVIHDTAGFPGCLMTVRLLGVLRAAQLTAGKRQRNDRLLGALDTERSPSRLRRLGQLGAGRLQALAEFFETYNRLEGRVFRATRWEGAGAARIVIRRGQRRHRQEMRQEMR